MMPRQGVGLVLHSSQTSIGRQVAAQTREAPCYFRAMDPGMAFGSSTGLAFTMVLGGIIGAHIRLFLTALGSIALPFFTVPTSLCFSFSSISTPLTGPS